MSKEPVQGAVRTCLGCRERATKRELLRVVAGDRGVGLEVVPDPTGRAPGRGAHLHPTSRCLDAALRRRAFGRALRVSGPITTTAVEDFVRSGGEVAERSQHSHRVRPDRNWSSSS